MFCRQKNLTTINDHDNNSRLCNIIASPFLTAAPTMTIKNNVRNQKTISAKHIGRLYSNPLVPIDSSVKITCSRMSQYDLVLFSISERASPWTVLLKHIAWIFEILG
mmetsp:Transcript_26449/g.58248  ORF Transcript_26449/g.58248 Transcript_26449/m.58248 type:complete len:107 (-) Transcript_26449:1336-1656(-)